MAKMSRRAFIATAGTVSGAAVIGVAGPQLMSAAAAAAGVSGATGSTEGLPATPVVAYVRDPKAGQLALMIGDREVTVQDRALVRRIVDAAR